MKKHTPATHRTQRQHDTTTITTTTITTTTITTTTITATTTRDTYTTDRTCHKPRRLQVLLCVRVVSRRRRGAGRHAAHVDAAVAAAAGSVVHWRWRRLCPWCARMHGEGHAPRLGQATAAARLDAGRSAPFRRRLTSVVVTARLHWRSFSHQCTQRRHQFVVIPCRVQHALQ